jgi:hypothetical protein
VLIAAFQPPWRRPLKEIPSGVMLLPAAKWFVPGSRSKEAGIGVSSSVEMTLYLIVFSFFLQGAFC